MRKLIWLGAPALTMLTLLLLALLLAGCGGGGGGGGSGGGVPASVVAAPTPVATPVASVPRDCTVDLWGDSILAGQGTRGQLAQTPAQYIQTKRPAYAVVDDSVSGSGANASESRLHARELTARFVVLEWGVNDPAQGYTDIAGVLTRDVAHVRALGHTPVLTGIDTAFNNPAIIAQPLAVAQATGAAYADWPSVQGGTVDGLHPDQTTSDAFAQKIVDVLDKLAPECMK